MPAPSAERRVGPGRRSWRKAAARLTAAAWLPALAACTLSSDPRSDHPDRTVAFATGWQAAADCSVQQLANLYPVAQLTHHPESGSAEIKVGMGPDLTASAAASLFYTGMPATGGGYSDDGTVMIIDFRDLRPNQAEAKIYAARYTMLPGGTVNQAAGALAACRTGSAPAPAQPRP